MSWLISLGMLLSAGGCYASLNGGRDVIAVSSGAEQSERLVTITVDTGVVAEVGSGHLMVGSKVGKFSGSTSGDLLGGSGELLLEVKPARSGKFGWDVRTAISVASVRPTDSSESGILGTFFIGPSLKKGGPTTGLEGGGFGPGLVFSYFELNGQSAWSVGLSFRMVAWVKSSAFGKNR